MSYDITIAADDTFSQSVPFAELRQFILSSPGTEANGERHCRFGDGNRLWMEIDLELVTEEGDMHDDCDISPTVNCVRLHIPYQYLGEHPELDYFPVAMRIAEHLGWRAIDDQTGESLQQTKAVARPRMFQKPWWKFW
jgi:hypothetical protein